jgi:hypothetical protein
MSQGQDLKRTERWAYLFHHEDGLIDITIGLIAMGFGLMIASDRVIFWLIFYILGIGIWRASKKWITNPRIGYVKSPEKGNGNKAILIGIIVANLSLLFVLGLILLNLKGLTT